MKKFAFSLETLYRLKKTLKDKLQAEYAAAAATLDRACREKEQLQEHLSAETRSYETKLKRGMAVVDILAYSLYFEEFQNRIKAASESVERAQREAARRRNEMIEGFKEVRILEKLRDRQYEEYKVEEERAAIGEIENIFSFKVAQAEKTDW